MSMAAPCSSNKQSAQYDRERVFGGQERRGLVKFAAATIPAAGPSKPFPARSARAIGQVAGPSGLAASITQNQALSGLQSGTVAPLPSHRSAGTAEFCRFRGHRRQIASFRTGRADRRHAGQLGASSARAVGVRPPAAGAFVPHAGAAGHTQNLAKSSQDPIERGISLAPKAARACAAGKSARNVSYGPMGSGVRGAITRERARGSARDQGFRQERVGVCVNSHGSLFPSKTATVCRGRG